ncbi:hypothetical protein JTB14_015598 [Gonioctena quinquepunctata]|nr:hypothetical protein JTB14_015598 [Gonioctena quinquepunctata]
MSKDIRSFFPVASKKHSSGNHSSSNIQKKPKPLIDSDDEDIIESTPNKSKPKKKEPSKRKVLVLSSDSEDEAKKELQKKAKVKEDKLRPVNIDEVFSNKPIKQSKVEPVPKKGEQHSEKKSRDKKKKKKENPEIGVHDDDDFEKTLLELDDDLLLENVDFLDRTIDDALNKEEKLKKSQKDDKLGICEDISQIKDKVENKPDKKRQRKHSEGSTPKKAKLEQTDSGVDPDQERFEKKRYSALLYQKYKNRGGPKHHGEKELPKGTPNCLKNLTFLRTGVLDSLDGEEFENLTKEHGGRVVHSVSKKVNYLVVGEDPGPSKLDKARGLSIPEISEDEFLDMILVKSGMKPKFAKTISDVSNESGIVTDEEPKEKQKKIKKEDKIKNSSKDKLTESTKKSPLKEMDTDKPNSKKLSASSNREHVEKSTTHSKPTKMEVTNSDSSVSQKKEHKQKNMMSEKSKKHSEEKFVNKVTSNEITKSKDLPQIERPIVVTSESSMSWTEKYKPKDIKSIIGQQGDNSNMSKLQKWLKNWYRNQLPEVRKKIPRPSPWAKNDDGAYYKAALLSGPPGVGKTTTANLVSKELGFDVVEFNASDTRSKRLLHEEVSQLLSTTTIAGFAAGKKTTDKKRVLLMDEVDGMAGNEDRGGMQELISLIKNSSIPIICMCNDRNHQKMRSLVNYCFDLRFNKPRLEQIRGSMMSICFKEGLKIPPNALSEIIIGTGCDIRQTLNHLAMWTADDKNLSLEMVQKETKSSKKDTVLGPWEVIRMVFSESEQKTMTVADKSRLFFYDYSLGPLFVQENFLNVTPNCPKKEIMKRVALTADAISMGDLIESKIRGSNNWSLLESQAMYSSVLPGFYMSGSITGKINFPGWLGKNSSANKHKRMLSELQIHTRISTSGNKMAMKLDYLIPLRNAIILPLKKYGTEGVHQAIEVMKAYNLLREDLTNLIELCQWKDSKNPFNDIDAKVKSAFTRAYNKEAPLLPFAPGAGFSKKKVSSGESDLLDEEEFVESDDEEKDDVTADTMIKVKTKTDGKSKKGTAKASTSKAKDSSKTKPRNKKTK